MSKYRIASLEGDIITSDILAKWVATVPPDESTVGIVAELFARYQAKGIPHHFSLFRYRGPQEDPTGVLLGLSETTAVFWRKTVGHFWLERDQLTFAHEAATLPGTHAPFVAEPKVEICYRFTKGVERTVASPYKCSALQEYRNLISSPPGNNGKLDGDDSTAPLAQTYYPTEDGFTLLGGSNR